MENEKKKRWTQEKNNGVMKMIERERARKSSLYIPSTLWIRVGVLICMFQKEVSSTILYCLDNENIFSFSVDVQKKGKKKQSTTVFYIWKKTKQKKLINCLQFAVIVDGCTWQHKIIDYTKCLTPFLFSLSSFLLSIASIKCELL